MFQPQPPNLWGERGAGHRVNHPRAVIQSAYVAKPLQKTLKDALRASGLLNASRYQDGGKPREGISSRPQFLVPCLSSIWTVLSGVLYNKQGDISKVFP